jgi:hypothetical protein
MNAPQFDRIIQDLKRAKAAWEQGDEDRTRRFLLIRVTKKSDDDLRVHFSMI